MQNTPISATAQAAAPTLLAIPSVDRVLSMGAAQIMIAEHGRTPVLMAARSVLGQHRAKLARGEALPHGAFAEPAIAAQLEEALAKASRPTLRTLFNLTGTVLHTNMGRALMPEAAVTAVVNAMTRPCNLEYDIENGVRGERDALVEELLCELTGADAATVVNNNAAAVFLALNTLGLRREVVVSRGELVEIGGSFRVPDIMARAGCRLKEVGTTNRTHLKDFHDAISSKTAMLLKVHTSNYAIQGFTASVSEQTLAKLAHEHELPVMVDLGSGTLVDLVQHRLPKEPTPQEALAAGVDLVTFSGDKLLGGPQAGIIVGRKDLVSKIKKNPLKRALRVDKMTYAALEAVLRLYRDPDRLPQTLPTLRLLTRSLAEIEAAAAALLPHVERAFAGKASVSLKSCHTQIGSGSLPVDVLPSMCVAIAPLAKGKGEGTVLKRTERAFRNLPVPVIGRITDGAFCLDLRCLEAAHLPEFLAQLEQLSF